MQERKDGSRYYEILVSRGRGKSPFSTRWEVPEGLSKRTIESRVRQFAEEFEAKCHAGEVQTRKDKAIVAAEPTKAIGPQASEEKTFRWFCEKYFMADIESRCSENTVYNYGLQLKGYIYPTFGDADIASITSGEINAFFLALQQQKNSIWELNQLYAILKTAFAMA